METDRFMPNAKFFEIRNKLKEIHEQIGTDKWYAILMSEISFIIADYDEDQLEDMLNKLFNAIAMIRESRDFISDKENC